jgi:hypothetical protein
MGKRLPGIGGALARGGDEGGSQGRGDNTGLPTCVPAGTRTLGESCNITNGSPNQTDTCDPGTICINAGGSGEVSANCFGLCRTPIDCLGGSACTSRPIASGTAYVCDPPYDTCSLDLASSCCDPVNDVTTCNGRPGTCYLLTKDSTTGNSRTVCEYASGGSGARVACTYSRECLGKLTCSPTGQCQRVCNDANPCPQNGVCTKDTTGAQYGYCPP